MQHMPTLMRNKRPDQTPREAYVEQYVALGRMSWKRGGGDGADGAESGS